jgi:geranylgeranyl diphosphate synthase type I
MAYDYVPYLAEVEKELRDILATREPAAAPLYQMMQYHLGWLDERFQPRLAPGGKRVRPLICLLVCEAVGGDWHRAVPGACAIELIHNFSLLHDDIEDRSETRRHRPTAWKLWGIPQGINTGDAMWAISLLAMLRLRGRGFSAEDVLRAITQLDEACVELCIGQYLDLHFESVDSVPLAAYERMIAGKTAALLAASAAVGAVLGGVDNAVVETYAGFGREFGLAFQIMDDILGVWGDPAATGKSAASDILTKKKALPALYALHWEQEHGYSDLAALYARPTLAESDVPHALALLERAGAREHTRQQALLHRQLILNYLEATQMSHPAQDALRELALSMIERSA